jgi:hypothetical protein
MNTALTSALPSATSDVRSLTTINDGEDLIDNVSAAIKSSSTHATGNTSTSSRTSQETTATPLPAHGSSSSSCGTPYDTIPNFALNPTMVTAHSGAWSSPSTWSLGRVPNGQDILVLQHHVIYDSMTGIADVIGIDSGASLRFRTDISTRLQVGIIKLFEGGRLEIGTAATPVAPTVTAELIIRDRPLNLATDPRQFGTGLLSHNGIVTMHGAVKSPTFVRTSIEPRVGHPSVTVEQPVSGWRVGDRIFLPDTRQVHPDNWFNRNWALNVEERTIQNISPDGRTITLSSALSFDHRGARDANGSPTVLPNGIKLLPHVGNLTRNIVIRSENAAGTRGHTLFTLRSMVDIRYVQFQDLGRTKAEPLDSTTNHLGRYPLHMHQLWGPVNPTNAGYQFHLVGNAVNDSLKWPLAVHGSHFGLIKWNVIFGGNQLTGAGIAVEDGSETENLFEENFVANIRGDSAPRQSGPSSDDGSTPGNAAECIWGAGFNNRFVNNIVSTCRNVQQEIVSGPGFKFITHAAPNSTIRRNPRFRGADMTNTAEYINVTNQYQPLLEFRGNEVYGVAADGFTAWELGTDGYDERVAQETVLKDFRVWHTYEGGVYNYPSNRITLDGFVFRIDPNPSVSVFWPAAYKNGDYRIIDLTIRNSDIHAGSIFDGGDATDPIRNFLFVNNRATTRNHAFTFATPATPGTGAGRPSSGVTMTLRNNVITAWPGQPLRTIEMHHDLSRGNSQPEDTYEVQVFDYQGQAGNNFRAYFAVQATQNLYGGLAPCNDTTSRPEVSGITCNIACNFSITPASESRTASGGTGNIEVEVSNGCDWIATSDVSWISINAGASGSGSATVSYSVSGNTTSINRSGTITIAGLSHTIYQGAAFLDVPPSHPFYTEIGKLSARGVTLGCGSGNYCPDSPVTREQMAAFVMRSLGEFNPAQPGSQRFADVPPSNPFYNFIDRLAALGITSGCGGGNYCPSAAVTREQMAAFIIRALGEPNPPIPGSQRFVDVPSSNPFYNFIDRMAALNITLGCSTSPPMYCPGSNVTRGQMAAFLVRAFSL